jgi:integrase
VRVAYSFRHYFATLLIERGLRVLQVADWLGTGTKMIEQHYNRYLTERNAHLLNGADRSAGSAARYIRSGTSIGPSMIQTII